MSSNFWTSSHCNYHLHTRSALQSSPGRTIDLQYCSPRQLYLLHIWFAGLIHKLGKRCNLKSVPISTAIVFFKRFYIKNAICETNPYLVLVACVYVAAKVEETPLHIKNIVGDAKLTFNENGIKMFPSDSHKVGEMEFYLLEDLDFHLVVFHPIRAMLNMTGRDPADAGTWPKTRLQEDTEIRKAEAERAKKASQSVGAGGLGGRARSSSTASQSGIASMTSPGAAATGHVDEEGETEEARIMRLMSRGTGEGLVDIDEHMLQMTMFIIADSYRTDVSLLYPPYIIALASIYIGCTMSATNMANAVAAATAAGASGNISPKPRSSQRPSASHAKSVEVNTALGIPLLPAVNALGGPGGGDHTASSPPSGSTIRRISSVASISSGAGRNAGANANASGPSPHSSQSGVPKKEPKPLAPAAKAIAAFIATFNVSLPVLFACVQDLLVLYPIWETFEQTPTGGRATPAPAAAGDVGRGFMSGASGSIGLGMPGGGSGVGVGIGASGGPGGAPSPTSQQGSRPTFGPAQAEELVRKMIEDRAIDLSHPDNVSSHGGSTASMDAGVKKGAASSGVPQVAGKKRRH